MLSGGIKRKIILRQTQDDKKINMQAKSIKGNSTEEITTELQTSMEDGFIPTLAIVFLSVAQDRQGKPVKMIIIIILAAW